MNKEKLIKFLIPLVAVVVVLESVILVSGLSKNNEITEQTNESVEQTAEVKNERLPAVDFVFAADSKEMKVGKSYKVTLTLVGKESFAVDAIEAYIKFDPNLATVSKLTPGTNLPEDKRVAKIDSTEGLISIAFLTDKKDGYQVDAEDQREVVSFMVTPKSEGSLTFDLLSGSSGEELVTLLPETMTSDVLPFTSNKLDINVTK